MSTLTSLSVNKGSTRFAPKVKPRISRAPTDAGKQANDTVKPTSSQKTAQNGQDGQTFSSGSIAKFPAKLSKPKDTTPIMPPIVPTARDVSGPPSIATSTVPAFQKPKASEDVASVPDVSNSVVSAATASVVPTVAVVAVTSAPKPKPMDMPKIGVRSKIDKARAASSLGKRKAPDEANQTKDNNDQPVIDSPVIEPPKKRQSVKRKEIEKHAEPATESSAKAATPARRVVSRAKDKEKEAEVEKETTPKPAFKGQERAVRAGTRIPILRTRESKGKEKAVDPMSRAVRATDRWNPINAKKHAPVTPNTEIAPPPAPSQAKSTSTKAARAAKKSTGKGKSVAKTAEKAGAIATIAVAEKITTRKTVRRKKTAAVADPTTDDEASTSEPVRKRLRNTATGRVVKRKRPVVPLKKRKLPAIPKPKPPPLLTLEDFSGDPMTEDILDRPMSDFIKDDNKGIVSKMFKEFEEARLKKRKWKYLTQNSFANTSEATTDIEDAIAKRERKTENEPATSGSVAEVTVQESSYAPQLQMINGQMVVDTESLAIKRSAMAEPINTDSMEIVEETSMSRLVNSQSFGKKSRSQRWKSDETEQFYNALAQWGTDFEMIARLFPHRNRRQIKLKFTREEKFAAAKVTDYLLRKSKPVDLDHYISVTGRTFNNEMKNMDVDFNNLVPEKADNEAKAESSTVPARRVLDARVPDTEPEEEVLGYLDE